jgi:hypothetical protein
MGDARCRNGCCYRAVGIPHRGCMAWFGCGRACCLPPPKFLQRPANNFLAKPERGGIRTDSEPFRQLYSENYKARIEAAGVERRYDICSGRTWRPWSESPHPRASHCAGTGVSRLLLIASAAPCEFPAARLARNGDVLLALDASKLDGQGSSSRSPRSILIGGKG